MSYCKKCGAEITEGTNFCPKCGVPTDRTRKKDPTDKGGFGWGLLGFSFPLVGLILYVVWKQNKPKRAKSAGKGALISVIVGVVFTIIFTVLDVLFAGEELTENSVSSFLESTKVEEDVRTDQKISRGTIDESTYTNKYFKITCKMDDNWKILTQEEIDELYGVASEIVDGEDYQKILEQCDNITELFAEESDGLDSININVTNVGDLNDIFDESDIVDSIIEGGTVVNALMSMGYENVEIQKVNVTFCGRNTYAARVTGELLGVHFYEMVVPIQEGPNLLSLTVGSWKNDLCAKYLSWFTPIA